MTTATEDQTKLPEEHVKLPDDKTYQLFLSHCAEAARCAKGVSECHKAEATVNAITANIEACEDEGEARRLIKQLSEAELELKIKKVRLNRLTAGEEAAWLSAAALAGYAIEFAAKQVEAAVDGAFDEFLNAITGTICPTIREGMKESPSLESRVIGSAESLAAVQPGVARAGRVQGELEARRIAPGGQLAVHRCMYAREVIDMALAEIPAIKAESAITKARAAALAAS